MTNKKLAFWKGFHAGKRKKSNLKLKMENKKSSPVTKESIEKISRDLDIEGVSSVKANIEYDLSDEGIIMGTLLSIGYKIEYLNNSYRSRYCTLKNGKKEIAMYYHESHGK